MPEENLLIYAASSTCADLRYLTGFNAEDPFVWFSVEGQGYMLTYPMEIGRARLQCHDGVHVVSMNEVEQLFPKGHGKCGTLSEKLIYISRHFCIDCWSVPADFPLQLALKLQDGGLQLRIRQPFCPEREVKSEAEIGKLRASQQLAESGLSRAIAVLAESEIGRDGFLHWRNGLLTSEDLRGEINAEIARLGGHAEDTIAAAGSQGADPHQVGHGPIPANVPIVMDIFPRSQETGYFGDLTRTVVKGKASDVVKRAYEVVHEAQQLAFGMIKAGVKGCDVHNGVAEMFEARGYTTCFDSGKVCGFFHGLGHGVGLEIHEGPSLNRTEGILRPGNTVTVEPGLYYPEWGGIRLENLVVVRNDGYEDLTTADYQLEVG